MKKTIAMVVLVGLLLGSTNAWMDNKIEKLEKEIQIVEESRFEVTQDELAKNFNISQPSISQRIKRANYDLIHETELYFRKKIAEL